MSDDLLQRELTRLSHRAQVAASPPPAEALVRRAKGRRARRHLVAATIVPVVAAAVVVSVVLSRSPAHQDVAVRNRPAAAASSATSSSRHVAAAPTAHHRSVQPQAHRRPAAKVPAASMGVRVSGGVRRCVVLHDPATASAGAWERSPLRSDPVSVDAVWKPSEAAGCRSTVTTAGAKTATRLLAAVRATKSWTGLPTCPSVAAHSGSVDLVFSYRSGPNVVVTMTLGSCSTLTLPGNRTRNATTVTIKTLDPPSWVGRGLFG
jgi:hypothetical protein